MIAYEDDASRKILSIGELDNVTTENAIVNLKEAESIFQNYLKSRGIKHIPSRRNNPQTNGKMERLILIVIPRSSAAVGTSHGQCIVGSFIQTYKKHRKKN